MNIKGLDKGNMPRTGESKQLLRPCPAAQTLNALHSQPGGLAAGFCTLVWPQHANWCSLALPLLVLSAFPSNPSALSPLQAM